MKKIVTFIVLLILLAVIAKSTAPQTSYDLFQKALVKEKAEGNLEEAIVLFQKVVDKGEDESLAAQAQLHIGMCYEKLGLTKAQEAYQKVIDRYPRQAEVVKAAKEKLALLQKALAAIEKGDREFKITKIHTEKSREGYLSPDGKKLALID
jgi:tetratricopeptide (TPR) repeat protein